MTHPNDGPLNDQQMDRLSEWLQDEIGTLKAIKYAVDNSNSAGCRAAEGIYDKLEDPTFRPRCWECGTSGNIRVVTEDPIYGDQELVCSRCYDEFHPEPDTGRPDFTDLGAAK